MDKDVSVGKEGEKVAENHLVEKGYQILERNWRFGKKELDLIARYGDKLVIIEVKTRTNPEFEQPKEAVTFKKQRNIVDAANAYIQKNNILLETQFDIISVLFNNGKTEIEHISDAFYPLVR